jgi:hypothetical protein
MAAPPPAQAYAGQVASGPAQPGAKTSSPLPIVLIVGVVLFVCACGAFFWWVDATFRWCTFFPFLSGC